MQFSSETNNFWIKYIFHTSTHTHTHIYIYINMHALVSSRRRQEQTNRYAFPLEYKPLCVPKFKGDVKAETYKYIIRK